MVGKVRLARPVGNARLALDYGIFWFSQSKRGTAGGRCKSSMAVGHGRGGRDRGLLALRHVGGGLVLVFKYPAYGTESFY